MGFLAMIIIGAAAGLFATRLMRVEADLVTTVALGALGAVIGGLVLRALIAMAGLLSGFVGAVLGAMLVVWLWQRYGPRG
ncbi:MAG: GlsB/YeaQ/YmgE family stress response membrane protein [Rhodobacteraceae bacterium]|nr:GlsB/YeaQ/YmgE family stress response membrane protein [Paracoccaceae bacterium]